MSSNKRQTKDRVEFAFKVLALLADVIRKQRLPLSKLRTRTKRFNRNQTKQFLRENPSIRDLIFNTVTDHSTLRSQSEAVEAVRENPQIMNQLFEPAPSPTTSPIPTTVAL